MGIGSWKLDGCGHGSAKRHSTNQTVEDHPRNQLWLLYIQLVSFHRKFHLFGQHPDC